MAATDERRQPAYVAPDDQRELHDRIVELKQQRALIGPGEGLVFREDVHGVVDQLFADLAAEKERRKAARLAELRAKICNELRTGVQEAWLNDADGLTPEDAHRMVDAGSVPGYQNLIVSGRRRKPTRRLRSTTPRSGSWRTG